MTQDSRPWQGVTTGDAGPYSSGDWQLMYARMIGYNADNDNYSILKGVDSELKVNPTSPTSAQIQIEAGAALVQGLWYYNDAAVNFTITANASGNSRIDLVILSVDYIAQEVRLDVITGTPAAVPAIPSVTQSVGVLWEVPIARVLVTSGFTVIAASAITDMRQFSNMPSFAGIPVVNNSANILERGNLVVLDTGASSTEYAIDVTTTTTSPDAKVIGIAESRMAAAGGLGRIIQYGIIPVICDGAVAVGDYLISATTAGQATKYTLPTSTSASIVRTHPFGTVLLANSGAGTACLAYVNFTMQPNIAVRYPMVIGTYTGNGGATQAITGIGYQPTHLLIYTQNTAVKLPSDAQKNSQMGLYASLYNQYSTDIIISLDADGFTVGDSTTIGAQGNMNANTIVFSYVAWR